MKSIELLTIGHELLDGRVINKNESTISQFLLSKGLKVHRALTIGDYLELICNSIHEATNRSDILIITGGLGPTEDDITRDAIAKTIGKPLVLNKEALGQIELYYKNKTMPESNKKQAYFPNGAKMLSNDQGTAPSFYMMINHCLVMALPGVPKELHPILEDRGIKIIFDHLKITSKIPRESIIKCFGCGESVIQDKLQALYPLPKGIELSFQASMSEVWVKLLTLNDDRHSLVTIKNTIEKKLKGYIFSRDQRGVIEHVADFCEKNKVTLGIAESCTGGLISKMITDLKGASNYFNGSIVAYSNDMKRKLLGVSESVLSQHGAVSSYCAEAMAEGVRKKTGSDIGLSVTGIAGPDGGTKEKPVGLVFIGYACEAFTSVIKLDLKGSREQIQVRASYHAVLCLLQKGKKWGA